MKRIAIVFFLSVLLTLPAVAGAVSKQDPLQYLDLFVDPGKNFAVIMKDGKIYKNTIQ